MNKKLILILISIIVIILIIIGVYRIFNNKNTKPVETEKSNTEFKIYPLSDVNITNSSANLIFLDDINGTGQEELIVNVGSSYIFNKYGEHTIKVLELKDDYITISIKGLAPTKESGGFSLIENYDKVTIKKNTGLCLNVQATDLHDNSVYLFYVNN